MSPLDIANRMGAMALSLVLGAALPASTARAETSMVSPNGFLVTHRIEVKAAPEQLFAAIGHPERWWSGEHTFSGNAANLSLGMAAGDCFCERWDGGSVEHARVIYVGRNQAVRLLGAFGPLQGLGVNAVLTFGIAVKDGKTILQLTYRVSGNADAGLDKMAAPVDAVLGEQVHRLAAFADGVTP